MQQTRTKEEKQELIQLYKQSGMSVRAFAEEFNLNLTTFRNWLHKKQPESKPADDNLNFVEVSPPILAIKIDGYFLSYFVIATVSRSSSSLSASTCSSGSEQQRAIFSGESPS